MDTRLSILFYGKTLKTTKDNLLPIYMRITINGERYELSTMRYIDKGKWCTGAGKVKGNGEEARAMNNYLDILKAKVYQYQKELIQENKIMNVHTFKAKWLDIQDIPKTVLPIFQEHNQHMQALVGQEFAPGTLERYRTSFDHTSRFIEWKYGVKDIELKKLDFEFISSYEFWLKSVRKCSHNTSVKYLSNFRKIINNCIRKGWLNRDPFVGFKMTKREVKRDFLTQEELNNIAAKRFSTDRLNQVRDIFLFSCYTGLAYADVKKLKNSEVAIGVDGDKWIFTSRQKTDGASRIPLLPVTLELINKYKDHPQCRHNDHVLPVFSNQKMNAYLKEIADVCGIHKHLTYHIARHTFATTVTLTNGVSIESVSKMLGHKNLRTTQHYAKILDKKVSDDMKALRIKMHSGK